MTIGFNAVSDRHVIVQQGDKAKRLVLKVADFLSSGAVGDVYRVRDRSLRGSCIKLYKQPNSESAEKLRAMLQRPPSGVMGVAAGKSYVRFAWPSHLVEDPAGSVIGFAMPEIDFKATRSLVTYTERREAQRFLSPEQRSLPRRVAVCSNLCALMADLHSQGHAFVDFKDQNVRVYPEQDLVSFIDNDGFRIQGGGGRLFPGLYTTPTFNSPESVLGPKDQLGELHDRFVLAILLFRILNHGIHPFQGVPKRSMSATASFDIDRLIADQCYAYGVQGSSQLTPTVGSIHEFWDSKTLAMFERTFSTADPKERISASEWVRHLRAIQKTGFVRCDQHPDDIEHVHFAGNRCSQCHLSDRSNQMASHVRPGAAQPSNVNPNGSGAGQSAPSSSPANSGLPPPPSGLPVGTKVFLGLMGLLGLGWLALTMSN